MKRGLLVLAVLLVTEIALAQQQFSPGMYPFYTYPRGLSDDVRAPVEIMMPDGGTWRINPPAIDGFTPPPIYTPPDDDDDDDDCCRHRRRHRR